MAMLSEGIVKINSKALEPSELKKLDKQEKEYIFATLGNVKGKNIWNDRFLIYVIINLNYNYGRYIGSQIYTLPPPTMYVVDWIAYQIISR
jgi:hypothetical protein